MEIMDPTKQTWIWSQFGARQHYAGPGELYRRGALEALITDTWVPPLHPLRLVPARRLQQRYSGRLCAARVYAWSWEAALLSASRWRKMGWWEAMMDQNRWFRRKTLDAAKRIACSKTQNRVVFSYNYTAHDLFRFAKEMGWTTVLDQIDPGPFENDLVRKLDEQYPELALGTEPAPDVIWEEWRAEFAHADRIVVNSEWSKAAFAAMGLAAGKIHVVPLSYRPPPEARGFQRAYPVQFTKERPLRILFLGQINLRKGVAEILDAARLVGPAPVEFQMVGPIGIRVPPEALVNPRMRKVGPVSRSDAARCCQQADVFLFPTHSDGFGLTQLEAQAWKLPILASTNCGKVVQHNVNGMEMGAVSSEEIARLVTELVENPPRLWEMSLAAVDLAEFSAERFVDRLMSVAQTAHCLMSA